MGRKVAVLAALALALVIYLMLTWERPRPLPRAEREKRAREIREEACPGTDLAQAAEDHIRAALKSPATAQFSAYGDEHVTRMDGLYTYVGYVDSQNSFGALLRAYFKVWMTCTDGRITVVESSLE